MGVDGSPGSTAALAWAAVEARLRQAELHAVHAWEDVTRCRAPYAAHCDLPSRQQNRAAAASLLAASVRAAFGQALPPGLRSEIAEGRPERVLLDRAADGELLVLGSTRRAGDFPAMGPVHRACLRGAQCPVVFVAPPATGGEPAGSTSVSSGRGWSSGEPAGRAADGVPPGRGAGQPELRGARRRRYRLIAGSAEQVQAPAERISTRPSSRRTCQAG